MLGLYRFLTRVLSPVLRLYLHRRRRAGKEHPERMPERFGRPGRERPPGRLIWLHAASVGEANSVLPLITALSASAAPPNILLTTGTVTSARLMEDRLPAGAIHQFVPIDTPGAVDRFLEHWHPDLALWLESEFWPNLILETHRRGVPMMLINARLSPQSYRRWRRQPNVIGPILQSFAACFARSDKEARQLNELGAKDARYCGDLKAAAPPLPADPDALKDLSLLMADRPRWLAASTHDGEEAAAAVCHKALKDSLSGLLTTIVPRHPERGAAIQAALAGQGLTIARRSLGERPDDKTDIYVADTLGELGLFYRLHEVAFIGGSLVAHGGQNPMEAARLDCTVLHGPHVFNFGDVYGELTAAGAARLVEDGPALEQELSRLLQSPDIVRQRVASAATAAAASTQILDLILAEIYRHLPDGGTPAEDEPIHANA